MIILLFVIMAVMNEKRKISGRLAARCAFAAALAFAASAAPHRASAAEFESFEVKDIRIDGLRRFDPGVIFNRLGVEIGGTMTEEESIRIIRELFETGFFRSVDVLRDGGVLVIEVRENPTIAEVNFSGVTELPDDVLEGMLKSADIVRARVFDRALMEAAVRALEDIYKDRNFYLAKVNAVVSPLPRNRVGLLFEVEEGKQASIRSIEIEGNTVFSDWTLRRTMNLEEKGLLNFFSDNYLFSENGLNSDLERIRTLYLEEGYLRFNIASQDVEVSPDKRHIDVLIRVEEGKEYLLASHGDADAGGVFEGEIPPEISEEELRGYLTQVPGDVFSSREADTAVSGIRDALGDHGYAFAEVSYENELNDEEGTVEVVYRITPGAPAYVRKIIISGNDRTRDEVIRRELLQFERERYSREKVESSRRRILRLGYFSSATITPERTEDGGDELDLLIAVSEGSVGNFQIGAGFSTDNDLSYEAGLDTPNIFGSGNNFSGEVSVGDDDKKISFSLDEFYHTDEGVSRHIKTSIADRESSENSANYEIDGLDVEYGYGIPYADDGKYNLFFSYEKINIDSVSFEYQDFEDKHGGKLDVLLMKAGLVHDTRDSFQQPTDGQRIDISADTGLPVLDLRYYKVDYEHDAYYQSDRLFGKPVWHARVGAGFGDGYAGDIYPFYHRYYVGGTGTLRGFESNSISGEKDSRRGGLSRAYASLEAAVDVKLFKTQKVFLAPFADAGIVGKETFGGFVPPRASAGIEIRWISPIGPLRFSWAVPLLKEDGDETQGLQFSVRY